MEPGARLTIAASEVDPGSALQLRIVQLQHLVADLLQKNQELRQALEKVPPPAPLH